MKSPTPFIPDIYIDAVKCYTIDFEDVGRCKVGNERSIYLYILLQGSAWISVDGYEPARLLPGSVASVGKPLEHLLIAAATPDKPRMIPAKYTPSEELGWSNLEVDNNPEAHPRFFVIEVPASTNLVPDIVPSLYLIPEEARDEFPGLWEMLSLLLRGDFRQNDVGNVLHKTVTEAVAELLTIWGLTKQPFSCGSGQAGCYDMRIRKVMSAIHNDIARQWTLEELADLANMSKSGISERFKNMVGDSPLSYLSRIRMQKAGGLLKTSTKSIAEIAILSGYQSESSFNKAFKKKVGITPGHFRDISRNEGCDIPII